MPSENIGARRPRRDGIRMSLRTYVGPGLVAVLAALVLGASGAVPARAGNYVIRSCSVPGYPSAPLAPWRADVRVSNMVVVDACSAGGGVGFRFGGPQQFGFAEGPMVAITRPPTGPQSEIEFVEVSLWYAARLAGSVHPLSVYSSDSRPDDGRIWMATGAPGAEGLSFEQPLSPDTHSFALVLACAGMQVPPDPPPDPCVVDNPMPLQVHGMEVTLREDTPPTVLPPVGTLVGPGPQSGVRTLSYAASDPHSGLAKVEVLLGDTVVKTHDLTPRCFYSDWTVCPASDDDTLEVDTRAVPNGSYDVVLRVYDAAGNQRVVHGDRAVEVFNEPPPESNNVAPFTLHAEFKGASRRALTRSYGQRVSVRGRLTQGSAPVKEGAPIEVLEKLDRRGAREKSMRTVMTKADGTFSIGVATSRPSRTIRLAYRPVGGGEVVSPALKLRVRAASRVRASLRGRVVRFNGRVLSGPIPKGGKRVQMEGRSPGSAWTLFKSLRTDKKGRFSGMYRLRVRRPGVVLKIRAVLPRQAGYGYLSSRSRAATLRVR